MDGGDNQERWSKDKAWDWYNETPWICGFNYIPANAINYTAMWEKTGFAPTVIEKELALAETVGFNTVRVILQYIVWEDDPWYFKQTFGRFLSICSAHNIKVIPTFFDDCAPGNNIDPSLGQQPEPLEGWYSWAWSPSPGHTMVRDTSTYPTLEHYVTDIMDTFKDRPERLAWDLYNEPSMTMMPTLPLVRSVFEWAREVNPPQPLTIAMYRAKIWRDLALDNSDIITFHCYRPVEGLKGYVQSIREFEDRPLICTEWMDRHSGSTVESVVPYFYDEHIGCLNWGLVNGKTQTHLWGGHRPEDLPFNKIWQHDLYTTDHQEYNPYEVQ